MSVYFLSKVAIMRRSESDLQGFFSKYRTKLEEVDLQSENGKKTAQPGPRNIDADVIEKEEDEDSKSSTTANTISERKIFR